MDQKLYVAAYCRVSTEKDDQVNSLLNQQRYFTEFISSHEDWIFYRVYFDEGISGTSVNKREGFHQMMTDAESRKFSLILTKEVSRFARNTVDTLSYTRKLKQLGVGVIFTIDNIDTRDNDGELRLSIMATLAQEESRKISERVKWGQKRRMEQGVVFGRDLLGYTVKDGRLTVNQDEAKIVRLIFHKYVNEGKGTHIIARELQEAGIAPKRSREWSNTVILRVLRNEKYVGDLCQKKTFTPDYLSHTKKYNRGNEKMVYLKEHHEPIIDRDTWNRTQEELKHRSPSAEQKAKYSNRYWCSGKIFCGECGRHFVSRTKKLKSGAVYKAWRCYAAANHGQKKTDELGDEIGCNSESINDKVLCFCIASALNELQVNKEMLKQEILKELALVTRIKQKDSPAALYKKIAKLESKKRHAIDLVLDGTITKEELKQQKAMYDAEIADLQGKINALEDRNTAQQEQTAEIQNYTEVLDEIGELDAGNEAMYRDLVNKIVVYNGHYAVIWFRCIPFGIKLHYQVSGRGANYQVTVDEVTVAEVEPQQSHD